MTMRVEFNPKKIDVLTYQLAGYSFIRKWLKPTDVVLDVGCGEAHTALFLAKKCKHIDAIDNDVAIILENRRGMQSSNLHFIAEDIFKFVGCSTDDYNTHYNIIICRDLIEHFTAKRGETLIMKLFSHLKDENSILFLGTVREGIVKGRPSEQGHIHEYSYQELKDLLESYFKRVVFFSQTDEVVTLVEPKNMCWRWIVMCWGKK